MFKLSSNLCLAILAINFSLTSANIIPRAAAGSQFITGPCTSDSDCASGCCGFNSGKCAGPIVAQERDGGCGFGDPQPNNNAAQAVSNGQDPTQPPPATSSPPPPPAASNSTPASMGSGKPSGTQFITGPCASDADCASSCCGFKSGKCAGPIVAQERDGGCGFGDAQPNDIAAQALRSGQDPSQQQQTAPMVSSDSGVNSSNPTSTGSGKPPGTQFITGPCASDSDCASACCGFKSGKCAGPIVAQERDGGCGFGDPQPNDTAAQALRNGQTPTPPPPATSSPPPAAASNMTSSSTGSGSKPPGTQFITGPCASDADCASGCCGFKSGKCAGPVVAQERDGGCGFGDAQPNDNAAKALTGSMKRRRMVVF